jgi:hypothetical protein
MTINRTAIAGALALNVPTVAAAIYLPATAVIVMAAALAMLGAALGTLVGWSFAGGRHELIELAPAREEQRAAA